MSSRKQPKRKIRPPKKSNSAQFTDSWDCLAQAIREIHKKNASILGFEGLYREACSMVLHKNGDKLYNGVREVITQHLEEVAVSQVVPAFPLSGSSQTSPHGTGGANFLKVLKTVWEDHTTCMLMIRDILSFMDRVYAKPANVPLVYDLGLDLFRDTIVRSQNYPIQNHLLEALLQQIKLERENEIIDRTNVKVVIYMLLELTDASTKDTIYAIDFENKFLEASSEYYRVEGQMLVGEYDTSVYMKEIDKRLNEEEQRVGHYLSPTTEPKIRNIVEEELISKHLKTVIEKGLIPVLRNEKMDDLGRMYKLFGRVAKGHDEMKSAISDYIRELGKAINETVTSNITSEGNNAASVDKQTEVTVALRWVQKVLDLKDKFDKVQNLALSNDKAFQTSFNEAFEYFINKNPKSPEFISLFIDDNLKKGLKGDMGETEEEIDSVLDKAITLFRFVEEKDVFERYYKQHLAKRLLLGHSVNDGAEKRMISKLKIESSFQFTTKLEEMFNNMRISSNTMSDFKE